MSDSASLHEPAVAHDSNWGARSVSLIPESKPTYRRDIQGLRALAVGLVLLYHAGLPFLGGGFVGVDVFFVISGFLITGLMLTEVQRTGALSLVRFYSRRARRILPAATTVLVATSLAAMLILPQTRWHALATEVVGSAAYVVNWVLAAGAVDYLNKDVAPSAVQHFWTLSIEEQFYLVWPLIIVIALKLSLQVSRRQRSRDDQGADIGSALRMLTVAIVTLTGMSLAWSVYLTSANPGRAFFVTTTRAWELGLGSVVALVVPQLQRIPNALATVMGWLGLALILAAAVLYQSSTPFPGAAALLPTAGAALVIMSGVPGHGRGAAVLLSARPMTWIGDISYSLYLWHWPLVVFATYLLGGTLNLAPGLALVLMSVLLAYFSRRFIERPFLRSRKMERSPETGLVVGFAMMMVSVLVGSGLGLIPETRSGVAVPTIAVETGAASRGNRTPGMVPLVGAEVLAKNPKAGVPVDRVAEFHPSAVAALKDYSIVYSNGCHRSAIQADGTPCKFGAVGAPFTIAIVGDSHAAQWIPALMTLTVKHGWELNTYTKSSCPFSAVPVVQAGHTEEYLSCTEWNAQVLEQLTVSRPDMVLTSTAPNEAFNGGDPVAGLASAWGKLRAARIPFAVVLDTPFPAIDIPECVASHPSRLTKCAVDRKKALAGNDSQEQLEAAKTLGDVDIIDLNAEICPARKCAAIIGNVLVYRDSHHLTATYSESLASSLGARMAELGAPV